MMRKLCIVPGCHNVAAYKGKRNGRRRYDTKCGSHRRPFRVRKKRFHPGILCWCKVCEKKFKRLHPTQVCCGEACYQTWRLRKRKITLRAQNCRMCGQAMKPRKGKLCCSERCSNKFARQRRSGGTAPVIESVPYYYRHRAACIERSKRYKQPLKVKQWALEHPERMREFQKKNWKRHRHKILKRARENCARLSDSYVKQVIHSVNRVSASEIPPDIIELKRNQLRLTRAVRKRVGRR